MDFDDTPEEAAYREQVREFLSAHATPKAATSLEDSYYARSPSAAEEAEHVRLCKQWQRVLSDNGWAGIAWPKE